MSQHALENLREDPVMAGLIDELGPVHLAPRRVSTFQSLTHAIVHQQLSGKAATTILKRFQGLFSGNRFPKPADVLRLSVEDLRAVGISRAKASYILDIAAKAQSKSLPTLKACEQLSDEEIIGCLTSVKGVGRWTAEILMIFNLGREDVLPVHDLGVRRGYQLARSAQKLPEPAELEKVGVKWSPYRSFAALYFWRKTDSSPNGKLT